MVVHGMPVQTTSAVRSAHTLGQTNLLITWAFGVLLLFHSAESLVARCLVMAGGAVAHPSLHAGQAPAATPEPDVRLSPHPALQHVGLRHRHHLPCTRSWEWPWSSTT